MDKECLDFFKERFPEHRLQVSNVVNTSSYIMFTIESIGPILCITLKFLKTKPEMEIDLVMKCSLTGQNSIQAALEFANLNYIEHVVLTDASTIKYTLSDNTIKEISLKESSMLCYGFTYYEKHFGFKNDFEEYRTLWMEMISRPFDDVRDRIKSSKEIEMLIRELYGYLPKISKYTSSSTIQDIFVDIRAYLEKNCPKPINKCNAGMTDHDFIFISGFIEKAFEFVMAATMIASGTYLVKFFTLKQFIYQFTHYSLVLEQLSGLVTIYNTNTQLDGSIGTVLDQIKNHYVIQLHDRVLSIGKENVKKPSNVELYGLESAEFNGERGKIKKYNPKTQRYTIQLDKDSSKRTVKRQNVKGIGGTKKYKRY
uniref:Uncharacterized protein n=1 Tax=viral metagenome TaxID=1070528 RepID=A0A6C0B9L9_9ZZZZ